MQRDEATLLDLATAAGRVRQFVGEMSEEAFLGDLKTQSAVLHQLMLIGEAVRRLSVEFRVRHSSVPWPSILAMRNKLIHEYNHVDLGEVWKTAREDIPRLLSFIDPLLPKSDTN